MYNKDENLIKIGTILVDNSPDNNWGFGIVMVCDINTQWFKVCWSNHPYEKVVHHEGLADCFKIIS